MNRRSALAGAGALASGWLGWPGAAGTARAATTAPAGAGPLQLVASFSILADIARQLVEDPPAPLAQAGEPAAAKAAIQVHALAGADEDVHSHQPSPSDIQRLTRADLVLVNGLGFEPWLDRLQAGASWGQRLVVASRGVEERRVGPVADPHAWLSPRQGSQYVSNIADALARSLGPSTAPALQVLRRADELRARLATLDQDIRRVLEPVPAESRRLITTHGSFGYFARDYGLTITPLVAGAGESEVTAGQMARMIRQIRAQRAVALFAENTMDARLLQRVADETGVAIGGTLYGDALSGRDGPAPNYLRLLAHNARTITQALIHFKPSEAAR